MKLIFEPVDDLPKELEAAAAEILATQYIDVKPKYELRVDMGVRWGDGSTLTFQARLTEVQP